MQKQMLCPSKPTAISSVTFPPTEENKYHLDFFFQTQAETLWRSCVESKIQRQGRRSISSSLL